MNENITIKHPVDFHQTLHFIFCDITKELESDELEITIVLINKIITAINSKNSINFKSFNQELYKKLEKYLNKYQATWGLPKNITFDNFNEVAFSAMIAHLESALYTINTISERKQRYIENQKIIEKTSIQSIIEVSEEINNSK